MPRGVKGSGVPKKRASNARQVAAALVVAAVAPAAVAQPEPDLPSAQQAPATAEAPRGPGFGESLQRGRRIDLMDEAELRAYAKTIGISHRDCAGLSVERLRQNCTAQLYELIDAL